MQTFSFPIKNNKVILALGAESAGNFSVYIKGEIYFSEDFGDLLEEENFSKFKKVVLAFLKKEKVTPSIILTDLHPLMKTTLWGAELAKKYGAHHIQVQHHHAHVFSAIGDNLLQPKSYKLKAKSYAIAMDGTGYGEDEKIWGGECFAISNFQFPISNQFSNSNDIISKQKMRVERIGHLENQVLIGGDLAIREPARMLIAVLSKFLDKKEVYSFIKKYYTRNEFEVLYNQLQQNFNCLETSSAGRVLDATAVLLGFSRNERKEKHGPTYLLEKNSAQPYSDLKPKITQDATGQYILDTNYVINYVINYLHKKDKKRLAATVQKYIAEGLYEIITLSRHPEDGASRTKDLPEVISRLYNHSKDKNDTKKILRSASLAQNDDVFFSGGLANNKIISDYLESKNAYAAKTIPRGDAGLSFGQIVYYLLSK